jgi:hypothetical protein
VKTKWKWVLIFQDDHWATYRARVPSGWLYRHRSVLTETTNSLTGERHPAQMAETMCFVPSRRQKP